MKKKTPSNLLKINTQNLKDALEKVNPGLATKEFVETTTHYLFSNNKIITYNDKICISYPFDQFNKIFSVKAKDFYNIIKTIKSSEFSCKITDKSLKIKSKDTEASININTENLTVKSMYDDLNINNLKFKKLNDSDSFIKGLSLCRFSTSKDATNQNFYCVSVTNDYICSSDNYRASFYEIKEKINGFLIPATSVNELIKYDFDNISVENNWVHFKNEDDLIFSSRLVDGNYPDLKKLFDIKSGVEIVLPKKLKEILNEVSIISQSESDLEKMVDIEIKDNVLMCTSSKDIAWMTKKIKTKQNSQNIRFQINPVFLSQILDKIDNIELSQNLIYFSAPNFNHFIAIAVTE